MIAAASAMIALALGALIGVLNLERATHVSEARAWTVSGPPCPSVNPGALAAGAEAPNQVTPFGGVSFARAHGALRCDEIGYDQGRSDDTLPVCQFDHPGALAVTTSRGTWAFRLAPLQPATVQVRRDVPQCVLGASVQIH